MTLDCATLAFVLDEETPRSAMQGAMRMSGADARLRCDALSSIALPSEARLRLINSPALLRRCSSTAHPFPPLEGTGAVGGVGSTSPLPPHTSHCRFPLPLQAGQAVVLWPWHLGHKTLS